jgi:peptidoglycan/xylan/chitin deacetylase (PgdA/CDA1 family)
MKHIILVITILAVLLTACGSSSAATLASPSPSDPDPSSSPTNFLPATNTPLPPTETQTPTATFTPEPTLTPVPTLTPTWAVNPAGKVVAPILLYHHVANIEQPNRYYISTDTFDEQMRLLHDWGYTAISIAALVNALTVGGPLPPRPVVITFDDGNLDVYQNAFPIMYKYGYTGTFFVIANRLGAKDFVGADQLKEMIAGGWEIGSHSMTHVDLTQNHASLAMEISGSRTRLETTLDIKVRTFAYPFGLIDPTVAGRVQEFGYLSAVGLGTSTTHTMGTLYYLNREEVRSSYTIEEFEALLPWNGPPS